VLHVVSGPEGVLLRREAARWCLPTFSGAAPGESWQAMGSFDDLDKATGTICRYRVLFRSHPPDGQTARWVAREALAEARRAEPLIDRTLALVESAP
jgi:hypothetical protein